MNNQSRIVVLLFSVIPLLAGFQCCNGPCGKKNSLESTTSTTTKSPTSPTKKPAVEKALTTIKTEEEFEDLIQKPTVIKFTASWCGACNTIEPLYKKIAQELSEYQFAYVDVDNLPKLAEKYKVRGMPTFLFFNNGEQLDGQIMGAGLKHDAFVAKINAIFKN